MFGAPGGRGFDPNHPFRARTTGGVGRPANARLLNSINVKDFGATGNGVTDDTNALQSAINAAQNAGGTEIYFPAGNYKISTALSVSKHVAIRGAGPQSIGNTGGIWASGGGVSALTGATGGTAIYCSSNISAFSISATDAVQICDLMIVYPTVAGAATGVTGISFSIAGGSANFFSVVDNVVISGADRGVQFSNCISQTVRGCLFWDHQSYGIYVQNTSGSSIQTAGDYLVEGNTFISGSTATLSHFFCVSGGGMRISANKFNTGGSVNTTYGINISPQTSGVSIEPIVITGNTIEGTRIGIQLNAGNATATMTQTTISANQIWGSNSTGVNGVAIQLTSQGSSTFGQPISGITIASNYLQVDGGSGTNIVYAQNTSNLNITGNTFGVVSSAGTTAFVQTSSLNSNVLFSSFANLKSANVS